jgi:hypothetical protein
LVYINNLRRIKNMKAFQNIGLLLILATASMTPNAATVTIQDTGFNCTGAICGIFDLNEVEITVQIPDSDGVYGAAALAAETGDPNIVVNASTTPTHFVGVGYTDTATTTFVVGDSSNIPSVGDTPEAAGSALTVSGGVLTGKLTIFGTSATSGLRSYAAYDFDNETFQAFIANVSGGSTLIGDGTFVNPSAVVVPVPAAVWLFGSGLIGLVGVVRRKASY